MISDPYSFEFALLGVLNGFFLVGVVFFFIVIRKQVVFVSAFTAMLAGCFLSLSASPVFSHINNLYYSDLSLGSILWFYTAGLLFEIVFITTYMLRQKSHFRKRGWVPGRWHVAMTTPLYLLRQLGKEQCMRLLGVSLVATGLSFLFYFFLPNIPGVTMILGKSVQFLPIMAITLALVAFRWWRGNPLLWVAMSVILGWGLVAATTYGGSRQPLLGIIVAFGAVACNSLPVRRIGHLFFRSFPLIVLALYVIGAYGSVRRMEAGFLEQQTVVMKVKALGRNVLNPNTAYFTTLFNDNSAAASLAAMDLVESRGSQPFYSFINYITNPIPRSFYPSKPDGFGLTLPRDLGIWQTIGYVNWGPGIPGHAANDGGIYFALIYGVIFGLFCAWIDRKAYIDSDVLAFASLIAMSPYLIGMARGDIVIFSIQITLIVVIYLGASFILKKILRPRQLRS